MSGCQLLVEQLQIQLAEERKRLEQIRKWDQRWYPTIAGYAVGLGQSGETVAAARWAELCQALRVAVDS